MSKNVIDHEATENLFGSTNIAAHLYKILHGMLREDHNELMSDCKLKQFESAKAMIHRIKGSLKYCKAPEYESALYQLEDDILNDVVLDHSMTSMESSCDRLYEVLEARYDLQQ